MTTDAIATWATRPGRHIVSLSGGKDSTALAIFLRGKIPNIEYVFCDTDKELPETYEYLDRLEAFLQQPIVRLNAGRGFDHWLTVYGGVLPSAQTRWCTRKLKIEPFEQYVGDDVIWSYIGIRADENRDGYISPAELRRSAPAAPAFLAADADLDGRVSLDAFKPMFRRVA